MDRDADRTDEGHLEGSPLGSFSERVTTPDLLSEGPVRFLLVSGDQDDGAWGLVGSFWLSIDGERGGFFVSPQSLWRGSEMVRSFKSARARGWTAPNLRRSICTGTTCGTKAPPASWRTASTSGSSS